MTQPDFCNPHTQPTRLRKPACTERSLDNSIVEISYPLLCNWQRSCKLLFPSEWKGTPVRARALSWRTGDTGTAEKAHPPRTGRLKLLLAISTSVFNEIVSRPRMYWPVPLHHAEILVGFVSTTIKNPNRIQVLGGDALFSEVSKYVPWGLKKHPNIKHLYNCLIWENTLRKSKYFYWKQPDYDNMLSSSEESNGMTTWK